MLVKATLLLFIVLVVDSTKYDDDKLLYWRRSNVPDCEPFTTKVVDCNKCVCGADGVSYCTRMLCKKKRSLKRRFTRRTDTDEEDEDD